MTKTVEKSMEDDNSMHFKTDSTNISSVFTKKPQKYAKIHQKIMEAYSNPPTYTPLIKTTLPPISRVFSEHIEISNIEVFLLIFKRINRCAGKKEKRRREEEIFRFDRSDVSKKPIGKQN